VITAKAFAGKHYAVYGLARSGLATVGALLASGARVTAWDAKEEARAKVPAGTEITNLDEADLSQFESLVVTPGLPLNRHPIAQRAREAGVDIIGDIELFARARPELPPHKVVGITGTNGKSTTTALVHHILKTAGVPATMGGNIGLPILAQDPLPEGGVYVLELSSYQIDLTQSLDCDVAVLLNITPDHLDRYESFEAYRDSKLRLFEMQAPSSVAVLVDADFLAERVNVPSIVLPVNSLQWTLEGVSFGEGRVNFSARRNYVYIRGEHVDSQDHWPTLQGPHNAQNVAAAAAVAEILKATGHDGQSFDDLIDALRTYPGLPHRMERIREKGGVLFVNDSKATNPTATAPALAAFERIRWICGGLAKTDNLDECAPNFGHVRKAYTIGEAGDLFARLLSPHMDVAECETLERAVGEAAAEAESGDTVLLSPACASFDQFRDFEARGDRFRELVGGL
jgi:UDP-N-acetylmuramoylalanine--D-glutamate ligase